MWRRESSRTFWGGFQAMRLLRSIWRASNPWASPYSPALRLPWLPGMHSRYVGIVFFRYLRGAFWRRLWFFRVFSSAQNMVFDAESKSVLHTEMAKKNLFVKRGQFFRYSEGSSLWTNFSYDDHVFAHSVWFSQDFGVKILHYWI